MFYKYYAVIDTNVVVSSMLSEHSIPAWIIEQVENDIIVPLFNDEILTEYRDVLSRNDFSFDSKSVDDIISMFSSKGIKLERTKTDVFFTDLDDVVFYEIVMTGRKTNNAYLVTGNQKHFPTKPFVVRPREMKDIIEGNNK